VEQLNQSALLETNIESLLIPTRNVACVQPFHNLEHALLVLVKSGYSAVPVLDAKNHVEGVISKTRILDHILGTQDIEFELLRERIVADAMDPDVPVLRPGSTFMQALEQSINRPFLCVVDDTRTMIGMLTRRAILVSVHQYLRQSNKKN
jgi:CBS domain-containing protein